MQYPQRGSTAILFRELSFYQEFSIEEGQEVNLFRGGRFRLEPWNLLTIIYMDTETDCRRFLEKEFSRSGLELRIIMESFNVELSSTYVEMGLGIFFAAIVRDLPALRQRRLEFIPLGQYFHPDHICIVLRNDKTLLSYQEEFVNLLMKD